MCPPRHFRIEYEINPWMKRANRVDPARAEAQWRGLYDTLRGLDIAIELVEQVAGLPDMTFAANAGIVAGKRFIPANFRYPERQPEALEFSEWFAANGYEIERIHEPHYWEGEGDVLDTGETVFAGYRFRTEDRALDHLDEMLGAEAVRLELVDPRFYHLDTCFCPLTPGLAMCVPPAFGESSLAVLRDRFDDLVELAMPDAVRFACNALVVDGTVVMNTGCDGAAEALEVRGYRVVATPTDEFIKAGGSVKCLVLTLDSFERYVERA
jgi:N-dimethylarginine dimethylaminohydrolase